MTLRTVVIVTAFCTIGGVSGAQSSSVFDQRGATVKSPYLVEGIVVDSTGRRLSGITIVHSFCPTGRMPCDDGLQPGDCTDAKGRFAFDLPTEGLYLIVGLLNGSIVGPLPIVVPRADTAILRLTAHHVAGARSRRPSTHPCVNSYE